MSQQPLLASKVQRDVSHPHVIIINIVRQVPGRSATRFFVASHGPVDPPAAAELKAHSDFVWLDIPQEQSYRTIGDSTLKVSAALFPDHSSSSRNLFLHGRVSVMCLR